MFSSITSFFVSVEQRYPMVWTLSRTALLRTVMLVTRAKKKSLQSLVIFSNITWIHWPKIELKIEKIKHLIIHYLLLMDANFQSLNYRVELDGFGPQYFEGYHCCWCEISEFLVEIFWVEVQLVVEYSVLDHMISTLSTKPQEARLDLAVSTKQSSQQHCQACLDCCQECLEESWSGPPWLLSRMALLEQTGAGQCWRQIVWGDQLTCDRRSELLQLMARSHHRFDSDTSQHLQDNRIVCLQTISPGYCSLGLQSSSH